MLLLYLCIHAGIAINCLLIQVRLLSKTCENFFQGGDVNLRSMEIQKTALSGEKLKRSSNSSCERQIVARLLYIDVKRQGKRRQGLHVYHRGWYIYNTGGSNTLEYPSVAVGVSTKIQGVRV
jgi:hypothetical protein